MSYKEITCRHTRVLNQAMQQYNSPLLANGSNAVKHVSNRLVVLFSRLLFAHVTLSVTKTKKKKKVSTLNCFLVRHGIRTRFQHHEDEERRQKDWNYRGNMLCLSCLFCLQRLNLKLQQENEINVSVQPRCLSKKDKESLSCRCLVLHSCKHSLAMVVLRRHGMMLLRVRRIRKEFKQRDAQRKGKWVSETPVFVTWISALFPWSSAVTTTMQTYKEVLQRQRHDPQDEQNYLCPGKRWDHTSLTRTVLLLLIACERRERE
jgi:hypothetical protein